MPKASVENKQLRPAVCQSNAKTERVVGFIGNCQAELLWRAFQSLTLSENIRSFYYFCNIPAEERTRAASDLAECDDLLVQDIQDFDQFPLQDVIPQATHVMRFPFLRFAAPWPYDDFNGMRDAAARSQDDPSLHTVTYYDGLLGRLRRAFPDPEARFAVYKGLHVEGAVRPERILDFEARRLGALDERFCVDIGAFIMKHFRRQQLFHTVNRPCHALLEKLLHHVLALLALPAGTGPLPDIDELRSIEVPIHPKVAERLDMTWVKSDQLYCVYGQAMDWETYVRYYISRYS
jgi:hypothetical protein